jgi:Tol biopolymer transport system component
LEGLKASSGRAKWRWLGLSAVALAVATALAWFAWQRLGPPARPVARQITFNAPGNRVTASAISPDGKYVAYHDQTGLYLRNIESGESRIVGLPGALPAGIIFDLYWSPQGDKLLADVNGSEGFDIWVITVSGQAQSRLLYRHAAWPAVSPDGRMIAFVSFSYGIGHQQLNELWTGSVNGDMPRRLVPAGETEKLSGPAWSPDGKWIAYGRAWKTAAGSWSSTIDVCPADGGPAKTLLAESSLAKPNTFVFATDDDALFTETFTPDWRLVFSANNAAQSQIKYSLWQVRIEPGIVEAAAKPEQLTQWDESSLVNLSSTTAGKRVSFLKSRTWIDVYLGELGIDATSVKALRSVARNAPKEIGLSSWTQDSQGLLLDSVKNGHREIFRQGPNEAISETLVAGPHDAFGAQISPDGAWLLYFESEPVRVAAAPSLVWLMRRAFGGGPAEKVLEVSGAEVDAFRCGSNPKATAPCVLGLLEGKDLVFYSVDPLRGKESRLGKIASSRPDGCGAGTFLPTAHAWQWLTAISTENASRC